MWLEEAGWGGDRSGSERGARWGPAEGVSEEIYKERVLRCGRGELVDLDM